MWKERILFALRFLGAIVISLLVSLFFRLVVSLLTSETSLRLVSDALSQLISAVIVLFVFAYRDGYGSDRAFGKSELLTYFAAFVFQIVVGFVFKYAVYISGSAYSITHIIWLQTGHKLDGIGSAPLWLYIVLMLSCDMVYLIFGWIGYRLGRHNRMTERSKLLRQRKGNHY